MLLRFKHLPFCLLLLPFALFAGEFSIRGTTDKDVAIYKPGEKMEFTLRVLEGETAVAGKTLKWTRTGDDGKTEKGEGVASESGLKITTSLSTPGFVRIQAQAFGEDGKNLQGYIGGWGANKNGNAFFDGGACVDPREASARPGARGLRRILEGDQSEACRSPDQSRSQGSRDQECEGQAV